MIFECIVKSIFWTIFSFACYQCLALSFKIFAPYNFNYQSTISIIYHFRFFHEYLLCFFTNYWMHVNCKYFYHVPNFNNFFNLSSFLFIFIYAFIASFFFLRSFFRKISLISIINILLLIQLCQYNRMLIMFFEFLLFSFRFLNLINLIKEKRIFQCFCSKIIEI